MKIEELKEKINQLELELSLARTELALARSVELTPPKEVWVVLFLPEHQPNLVASSKEAAEEKALLHRSISKGVFRYIRADQ